MVPDVRVWASVVCFGSDRRWDHPSRLIGSFPLTSVIVDGSRKLEAQPRFAPTFETPLAARFRSSHGGRRGVAPNPRFVAAFGVGSGI